MQFKVGPEEEPRENGRQTHRQEFTVPLHLPECHLHSYRYVHLHQCDSVLHFLFPGRLEHVRSRLCRTPAFPAFWICCRIRFVTPALLVAFVGSAMRITSIALLDLFHLITLSIAIPIPFSPSRLLPACYSTYYGHYHTHGEADHHREVDQKRWLCSFDDFYFNIQPNWLRFWEYFVGSFFKRLQECPCVLLPLLSEGESNDPLTGVAAKYMNRRGLWGLWLAEIIAPTQYVMSEHAVHVICVYRGGGLQG